MAHDLIRLHRGAEAVPLLDECLQRAVGKHVHWNFKEVADSSTSVLPESKGRGAVPDDRRAVGEAATHRRGKLVPGRRLPSRHRRGAEQASAPGADRVRLAKDEADRAMVWLNKAVAAGYNHVDEMKMDDDLDRAARSRGLPALMATLESKAKSKLN